MKKDPRINSNAVIYNLFDDLEQVKEKYVDTSGVFANHLEDYADLDNCSFLKLMDADNSETPFISNRYTGTRYSSFSFFLPIEYINVLYPFKYDEIVGEVISSEINDDTLTLTVTVKPTEKFLSYVKSLKEK